VGKFSEKEQKMKTRYGFTLVEVLLVVLILAVLASVVIPRIAESAGDAKDAKCDSNIANLRRSLELYCLDNDGEYPASDADFQSNILSSATYFPHGTPVCPYADAYVFVPATDTITSHSH
jgi:prepilin-type N-terminal cleavage/methylation domain-containing protein